MQPDRATDSRGDVFPNFEAFRRSLRQRPRKEGTPQPIAAETLEARRLLTTVSLIGTTLNVAGDGTGEDIVVYQVNGTGSNSLYVIVNGATPHNGPYNGASVNKVLVSPLGGNDTITIETDGDHPNGNTGVEEFCDLYGGADDAGSSPLDFDSPGDTLVGFP